jgi:serine O-acetyltransferase
MGLIADLKEDWEANDRDWSRAGLQALAVHRFGVWRMGIGPRLARLPFTMLYQALSVATRNVYGVELPYTAKIGRRLRIEHQGVVVVHTRAVIGDDCRLHQGVTLGAHERDGVLGIPTLGNRVYVGANASIIGGVHVGDGARIGAGAVVVDDVPPGATVVGVPARVRSHGSVAGV